MNLVLCERYGTKLTAAACEKFRENTPMRCKGCDGPVETEPINTDHIADTSKKVKETKGKKMNQGGFPQKPARICSVGGCTEKHLAKGFCKKHYDEDRSRRLKAERAQKNDTRKELKQKINTKIQERIATKNKTDKAIGKIELKFYPRDQEMFKQVTAAAEFNRRSLNQEVLFRLEHGEIVL